MVKHLLLVAAAVAAVWWLSGAAAWVMGHLIVRDEEEDRLV